MSRPTKHRRWIIEARLLSVWGAGCVVALLAALPGEPAVSQTLIPPTVGIGSPADGSHTLLSSIPVSGSASDDQTVALVEVSVNSSSWQGASGTTSWSTTVSLQVGANSIAARARDNMGLYSSIASVTVYRDQDNPPTVSITSPPDGVYTTLGNVLVAGEAADDHGVVAVAVRVNGGFWQTATGTNDWSLAVGLGPGNNLIEARSQDTTGQYSHLAAITVYRDAPPTISITSPADGFFTTSGSIQVSGTASDDHQVTLVEVRVNGGSWQSLSDTTSWSIIVSLSPDANLIEARARDNVGQYSRLAARTVYRDLIPPTVGFTAPAEGSHTTLSHVTVNGVAQDNYRVALVEIRIRGGAWAAVAGTASWSTTLALIPGANLIEARAQDGAGQYSQVAGLTVSWDPVVPVDGAPTVQITSPAEGSHTASPSLLVSGVAADDHQVTQVELRVNGGSWGAAAGLTYWNQTVALNLGPNSIQARAQDNAAQYSSLATVTVTRDPQVDGDLDGDGQVNEADADLVVQYLFGERPDLENAIKALAQKAGLPSSPPDLSVALWILNHISAAPPA